ncbi:hypothetical protein INS49_012245 [Diaporthe citri]|uniref:uncharacterized protein n=1 Tax=Diaporthe citri TaxID=83186 RepID=UPI001C7FA349|nr:uncharacterized protein INS49_012245 [Diaporthe citri]KAG6358726.1 hypothetical protein INS49_012245 [Diaporthe citri]
MSGLEGIAALGLACSIFQVISFGRETLGQVKGVYRDGTLDKSLMHKINAIQDVVSNIIDVNIPQPASINIESLGHELLQFIIRYEQGYRAASDLVSKEALQVREVIVRQSAKTEEVLRAHFTQTSAEFEQKFERHIEQASRERLRERLLKSLKYPGMNELTNQVENAHARTFRRLFADADDFSYSDDEEPCSGSEELDERDACSEDTDYSTDSKHKEKPPEMVWDSFTDWLQSNLSIYWIMGKPGSGKSTLAKFVLSEPRTRIALEKWHPGAIIASHFFWRPGSLLQRSIKGMLCSLVHQLVLSIPEALECAAENVAGLDECGPEDNHQKLLEILEKIRLPNVKIIASSRNEPVLEKRFRHEPQLRVQDLTAGDLRIYARDVLSHEIQELFREELVERSEGVFLWMILAVQSINRGLNNVETHTDLRRRVRNLPKGLNDLYKDMWERMNEDGDLYRESAALYFKLAIAAHGEQLQCLRHGWSALEMMLASFAKTHYAFSKSPVISASQLLKEWRLYNPSQMLEDYLPDLSSIADARDSTARELTSLCYELYSSSGFPVVHEDACTTRIAGFFGAVASYPGLNRFATSIVQEQLSGSDIRSAVLLSVASARCSWDCNWTDPAHPQATFPLELVRKLLSLPKVDVNLNCPLIGVSNRRKRILAVEEIGPLDHIKVSPFARLLGSGLLRLDWRQAQSNRHQHNTTQFLRLVSDFALHGADFRSTLFLAFRIDYLTRARPKGQEVLPGFFQIPELKGPEWSYFHHNNDSPLGVVALHAATVIERMLASLPMTGLSRTDCSAREDGESSIENEDRFADLEKATSSFLPQGSQEYSCGSNDRVIGFLQPGGNFADMPYRQVSDQDSARLMEMIWACIFKDGLRRNDLEIGRGEIVARSPFSSIGFKDYLRDMRCFDELAAHKLQLEYKHGTVKPPTAHTFKFWQL